ncbi:hypothetical protein PDO_1067 [Rhizobium sp. PDO1-076]|uniref:hypothetical protein n=1 Tax=Rhizobium sp. PDO1-076 TaxID=1125979 RepID=UPI00024E3558|nr:hypothetical protein [Rhizobium sp. PDO1-076]EHS53357.1 hypothetical protein PDO_1067 [Rhizobium sp. PDO1-076]
MHFLKVTSWIWLGLISAGLTLLGFGLQKQPIMIALVSGSALGHVLAAKTIAADPGYAAKANILAMIPALLLVVIATSLYA